MKQIGFDNSIILLPKILIIRDTMDALSVTYVALFSIVLISHNSKLPSDYTFFLIGELHLGALEMLVNSSTHAYIALKTIKFIQCARSLFI